MKLMVDVPVDLDGTGTVMRLDIDTTLTDGDEYGRAVGTFIRQFKAAADEAMAAVGEVP